MFAKLEYLCAHFHQTRSALLSDTIQQFALVLTTASLRRSLLRFCLFLILGQFFGALGAKKAAIWTGLAVGCDGESFFADFAVV
jgi:hypothetical protein